MNRSFTRFIFLLFFSSCKYTVAQQTSIFELRYVICGMGSNFGNRFPVVQVSNNQLYLTNEQNSWIGEKSLLNDTIAIKSFRASSMDSIQTILTPLIDTSFYDTDPMIMSGTINYLTVTIDERTWKFTLHNGFDENVKKIVTILNTYIEKKENQLW